MTTMEIIKSIDSDTYERIVELLEERNLYGDYFYTVEEVAEIVGVSVEAVQYVDRAENSDC
jgi:hypothetical protein